ncbi:MAG: hypothetical protein QNI87_13575 [Erythrobacter sp.]|uniref:hypothetical protein n=1 Tax=Erythrobacter sp. TaxID=1042 RepID=UPI00261220F6|nr:hypothetical protein [Erythrobacter sp.]MDJ0979552.1 hypothetical protein [Erythrobacter sp.]
MIESEPEPEPEPELVPSTSPEPPEFEPPSPRAEAPRVPPFAGAQKPGSDPEPQSKPRPEPEAESAWEHGGGYKPDVDFQDGSLLEGLVTDRRVDGEAPVDLPTAQEELAAFLKRIKFEKHGAWYIIGIVFLLYTCS